MAGYAGQFPAFSERNSETVTHHARGGRFISIQSQFDKGEAMKWWQARQNPPLPLLIALGDSPNDLSLLAAADVAVVIKSGKSDQLDPQGPATSFAPASLARPAGMTESDKF